MLQCARSGLVHRVVTEVVRLNNGTDVPTAF